MTRPITETHPELVERLRNYSRLRLTAAEIAERTGMQPRLVRKRMRALGLSIQRPKGTETCKRDASYFAGTFADAVPSIWHLAQGLTVGESVRRRSAAKGAPR